MKWEAESEMREGVIDRPQVVPCPTHSSDSRQTLFLCLPALCFLSRIKPPSHRFSSSWSAPFLVLCLFFFLPPSIRLRAESRKTSSKEEDLERTKRRDQHITERGQNTIKHKHQRQRTTQARAGTRKDDKSIPWKL